jgi:hypothetical protein
MSQRQLERSILIVAYHFPPIAAAACLRAAHVAALLAEREWNVCVLHAAPGRDDPTDAAWAAELEECGIERVAIEPVAVPSLARHSMLRVWLMHGVRSPFRAASDYYARWEQQALIAAEQRARQKPFNLVLGIAPPLSVAHAAEVIARRLGVPFALDLGERLDLLAHRAPSYAGRSQESTLGYLLRKAFYVTVTSRRQKEQLLRRFDVLTHDEVGILPHRGQLPAPNAYGDGGRRLVLVADEIATALVRPILATVRNQQTLKLSIVGRAPKSLGKLLSSWQLGEHVRHVSGLTSSYLDEWIASSDGALALATRWCTTPSSVIERIVGAGLPLLAIGELAPAMVADLPNERICITPKITTPAVRSALSRLLEMQRGEPRQQDESFEREFSRRLGMVMKL